MAGEIKIHSRHPIPWFDEECKDLQRQMLMSSPGQ
jgi:hypothetical protein